MSKPTLLHETTPRCSGANPQLKACGPRRRPSGRALTRERGFALVAVIWILGLVTVIASVVIVGSRNRARASADEASIVNAQLAAESAVNLAISRALSSVGPAPRFPLLCRMPKGEAAMISLEEEVGKIDLNSASSAVLTRFFAEFTHDQTKGARIAAEIVALRPNALENSANTTQAPSERSVVGFATIMQLDQLDAMSPALFRAALPFITVHSGRTEPELEAAPAALQRIFRFTGKAARSTASPAGGNFTIRAEIAAQGDVRFVREAVVSIGPGGAKPFTIREWRQGDLRPGQIREWENVDAPCIDGIARRAAT